MLLHANVVPEITGPVQRGPLLQGDLEVLRSIKSEKLADSVPENGGSSTVDVLIGSDYFWEILEGERVILPSGLLLLSSKFGYILTGKYHDPDAGTGGMVSSCLVATQDPCLSDLWSLDCIGIRDPPNVKEDDKALEEFNRTVCYEGQRYYVTWPWKSPGIELPDNFNVAFGRMKSLARRLQNDQSLLQQYCDVIKSQVEAGIIEIVDDSQLERESKKYYLPHHPVITPLKTTTKVRIVYDASVKANKGAKSLNDCLYRGPINLPDMCGMLLRFRTYYIAILADIEKAFLQIGIQEHERDITRFLWFKDPSQPERVVGNLSIYRFCRVPFGIICSPFLLEATLKYHLKRDNSNIATMICNNIYVDNLSVGATSFQEACDTYKEAKSIFKGASMNLREWSSNCDTFLNCLPKGEQSKGTVMKVFGLLWNNVNDCLQIRALKVPTKKCNVTKRCAVSDIAKVYDPLGLVTPIVFHGKVFLQKLWFEELRWDDYLPSSLLEEWEEIVRLFQQLSELQVPRYICENSESASYQILTFCDASAKSYAAAVYLRVVCGDTVRVHLIFAKMRLSPVDNKRKRSATLKHISLPRLELMALLIGTRATNFVVKELTLHISKVTVLTDSQCVLHWVRSCKPLPVFVQNRVDEIRQQEHVSFGYIPSENNPADLATRGLTVTELKESSLWWHGPIWIQCDEHCWPSWNLPDVTSEELEQMLSQAKSGSDVIFESSNVVQENEDRGSVSACNIDERKYSCLRRLLRITALCLKFIRIRVWSRCSTELKERICKQHQILKIFNDLKDTGSIYFRDLVSAKLLWVYVVQHRTFADVFRALITKQKNGLQKQLGLELDKYGILRCHGRFLNAELSEDTKYPKLIPRHEYFTRLVIREVHERLIHAGISHTLASLRQEYWLPKGRIEVRACVHHCLVCRRHEGPAFALPRMPPWPRQRVSESLPFQFTGLDYLGPVFIKEDKIITKMWICLFTCLAVRAVHLEWVRSLSAEHFLLCLRRFMAKRGRPEMIISDNAAQFKLVKSVVDEQWRELTRDEELISYLSNSGIKWQFTTALAPWQGGFFERLVGLVKRALRKGIGSKRLTLDQFVVVLAEVEAVVNTRPLTYVYEDFKSGFTLTPAHFLNSNLKPFPLMDSEIDYCPTEDSVTTLLNKWRKGQIQLNTFWNVWRSDYLTSLRDRTPHHKFAKGQIHTHPEVGQVVLIKEDNVPRGVWKIGRIQSLRNSVDGKIRSAEVYLPNGRHITRAINCLYPLEITDKSNQATPMININNDEGLVQRAGHTQEIKRLPIRQAAITARKRVNQLLKDNALTVLFVLT